MANHGHDTFITQALRYGGGGPVEVRVTSGCVCSLRFDPQAGSSGVVRCTG